MKAKEVQAAIVAAGFTVTNVVKAGRWYEVEKGEEQAVILFQHQSAWHWFSKPHQATASNSQAKGCDHGGLGDAISDDRDMKQYKQLIRNAPEKLIKDYNGLYAASSQVYNEDTQ